MLWTVDKRQTFLHLPTFTWTNAPIISAYTERHTITPITEGVTGTVVETVIIMKAAIIIMVVLLRRAPTIQILLLLRKRTVMAQSYKWSSDSFSEGIRDLTYSNTTAKVTVVALVRCSNGTNIIDEPAWQLIINNYLLLVARHCHDLQCLCELWSSAPHRSRRPVLWIKRVGTPQNIYKNLYIGHPRVRVMNESTLLNMLPVFFACHVD